MPFISEMFALENFSPKPIIKGESSWQTESGVGDVILWV